ncbi:MAG TPA: hypothetical protein VM942_04735 [Acidimicrobiales bacterium]|nr:hypothetical protein [Acidimicrobiales bacterium]
MTPYLRRRLVALAALVVVGGPAFLVGGTHWEHGVDRDEAVARFRAAIEASPEAGAESAGLPVPGVYRYRTTGGENVSFLEYRREYTPVTHRIVTRYGCGIREEQHFLVQHLEYYDRCGERLVAYGTDIAFWWTHGTQDFACTGGSFDGSGMEPGDRVEWECGDEDTVGRQTTEYVADEEVEVDGRSLPARHTRWTTVFSGATKGTAVVDDWFDVRTGLVLRETRAIGLRVGSPFVGDLSYIDVSEYLVLSTTPDR